MISSLILIAIIVFSIIFLTSRQERASLNLAAMAEWDAFVKRSLVKYRYREKARKDAVAVLKEYKGLRPKMDFYTFNDGARKELFSMDGTIPVNFKGNKYNIPICIWLMESHPDNPPLAFVTPTADMLIRPSINVDVNGRVYLPYLQEWKYPSSNLTGLVKVLCVTFSETSPLYAKSVGTNPAYPSPQPTKRLAPPTPTSLYPTMATDMDITDSGSTEVLQLQRELRLLKEKLKIMELNDVAGKPERSTSIKDKKSPEEGEICKLCMARRRNTVFLCGHSSCKECAETLINCIKCKQRITKKIYLKDF